jgi:hypothetical protein
MVGPMTAKKAKLIPAVARLPDKPHKTRRAARIREQRQVAAWRKHQPRAVPPPHHEQSH